MKSQDQCNLKIFTMIFNSFRTVYKRLLKFQCLEFLVFLNFDEFLLDLPNFQEKGNVGKWKRILWIFRKFPEKSQKKRWKMEKGLDLRKMENGKWKIASLVFIHHFLIFKNLKLTDIFRMCQFQSSYFRKSIDDISRQLNSVHILQSTIQYQRNLINFLNNPDSSQTSSFSIKFCR